MTRSQIEYDDTQGLVRFGFGALTEACYVLARVRSVAAARSWLHLAPVTSAVELDQAPATASANRRSIGSRATSPWDRTSPTATGWRLASSCSAIETSTASTPIGR